MAIHVANTRLIVHCPASFPQNAPITQFSAIAPVETEASETKPLNDKNMSQASITVTSRTPSFTPQAVQFKAPDQTRGQSTPGIENVAKNQIANNSDSYTYNRGGHFFKSLTF